MFSAVGLATSGAVPQCSLNATDSYRGLISLQAQYIPYIRTFQLRTFEDVNLCASPWTPAAVLC